MHINYFRRRHFIIKTLQDDGILTNIFFIPTQHTIFKVETLLPTTTFYIRDTARRRLSDQIFNPKHNMIFLKNNSSILSISTSLDGYRQRWISSVDKRLQEHDAH
jgi:hypothetical protein